MSRHNPTPLRVGMRGSLHGWSVRVAARLVLGVEIDGETYYWNEFYLIGDSGNHGTLVFEETEDGPEWKLFREFQPVRAMSAAEAAIKRVGDTVNLDGTPTRITLVDESRVHHIEGEAPEGVEVGDVAHYFNADTGRRMLVASWTGDEIEFYEGEDVPASLVAQAFSFASDSATRPSASQFRGGDTPRPSSATYAKVIVVLLFIAAIAGVFLWQSGKRRTSSSRSYSPAAPAFRLAVGAHGKLGLEEFTINGSAEVEIARVRGRLRRHEYQLRNSRDETAFLISGLTGSVKEWHLLRPAQLNTPRDPYEAAALRKSARLEEGSRMAIVAELFRATTLSREGAADALPAPKSVRYGFVASRAGDSIIARWDETDLQFHAATQYAESDIQAAFAAR